MKKILVLIYITLSCSYTFTSSNTTIWQNIKTFFSAPIKYFGGDKLILKRTNNTPPFVVTIDLRREEDLSQNFAHKSSLNNIKSQSPTKNTTLPKIPLKQNKIIIQNPVPPIKKPTIIDPLMQKYAQDFKKNLAGLRKDKKNTKKECKENVLQKAMEKYNQNKQNHQVLENDDMLYQAREFSPNEINALNFAVWRNERNPKITMSTPVEKHCKSINDILQNLHEL